MGSGKRRDVTGGWRFPGPKRKQGQEFHLSHLAIIPLSIVLLAFCVGPAKAVKTCIHDWAVPGTYILEGNFRGAAERTTAQLNRACRVIFNLPGVYSGGPVTQSGNCLQFTFKVENDPNIYTATWCGAYATIPWQGREIRATVYRRRDPDEPQ